MSKPVILFLAANPDDTTPVALHAECAATELELKMTHGRDDFVFYSKWAVTVDDLMRHLNELQPAIVHFSGHGNARGILLHGKEGGSHLVAGAALTAMIVAADPLARLVVLNACFSDVQAQLLSEAVGCAVGMNGTVSDEAAQAFSVAFYRALGQRHSAHNAFVQAKAALAGHGVEQEANPRCLTRADIDASKIMFGSAVASTPPAREPPQAPQGSEQRHAGIEVTNHAGGDVISNTFDTVHAHIFSIGAPVPKGKAT